MKKVRFSPANLQNEKREKGVPFVVSYHPVLNSLVSFRSARKLSSYLVRPKLYPLQRKVGSSKCGKRRCEVCNNVTGTSTFSSAVTGDTFKLNHSLNCDDKCLIYLMICKWCNKQHTGETTDLFRSRWNSYKTMLESLTGKSLVCSNTYINIFRLRVKGLPEWGVSYIYW